MPDLHYLAHVVGWKPYNFHHLGHVCWVEFVLHRSSTASHNGGLVSALNYFDGETSDVCSIFCMCFRVFVAWGPAGTARNVTEHRSVCRALKTAVFIVPHCRTVCSQRGCCFCVSRFHFYPRQLLRTVASFESPRSAAK